MESQRETGLNLFPEFISNRNTATLNNRLTLETVIQKEILPTETPLDNTCILKSTVLNMNPTEDYRKQSYAGSCVFLTNGWILATYHQFSHDIEDSMYTTRSKEITIITSRGDSINSTVDKPTIRVAAISPREDLALLTTHINFPYITDLCIKDSPATLSDGNYVTMYTENGIEKPKSKEIKEGKVGDKVRLHANGNLSYKVATFTSEKPVIPGESGSPVYDSQGCLVGIINQRNQDTGEGYYSPRVKTFLERYIASTSTTSMP